MNKMLYKSISPVNIFRIISNGYFKMNFNVLPDRTYYPKNNNGYYQFIDITDKVKY